MTLFREIALELLVTAVFQEQTRQGQRKNDLELNGVRQLLKGVMVGAASRREVGLGSMFCKGVRVNDLSRLEQRFPEHEGR